MLSEKKLHDIIARSIKSVISEKTKKRVDEGSDAGYNITIEGLNVQNVHVDGNDGNGIRFTAELSSGMCEWSANSYDKYVTSKEGVYDGHGSLAFEYEDADKEVEGGAVKGFLYTDEGEGNIDAEQTIKDVLTDFDISVMYGGGYSHVNLDTPEFTLTDIDVDGDYDTVHIDEITIKSKAIADNINWYFEHADDIDDMDFGVEYVPEDEPVLGYAGASYMR